MVRSLIAILMLSLATTPLPAGETDVSLPDMHWLTGTWVCTGGNFNDHEVDTETSYLEEVWSRTEHGAMIGMFSWVTAEHVVVYELLTIEEVDGVPAYRLRHFDQALRAWEEKDAPLVFPVQSSEESRVAFENPELKSPYRLVYELEAPNQLRVDVVGRNEDGTDSASWLRFKRVEPAS